MRDLVRLMLGVAVAATMALSAGRAHAEDPNAAPNPYRAEGNWAKLPEGRVWGQAIGVDIDRDGTSVWVFDRCGAKTCEGSNIAPIQKFDASGKLVTSFGAGMINWPHGLFADRDGNVWVTDGRGGNGKGHTVIKFSSDGKVLMTLGKPGVAGEGPETFNGPSDVLVAPNGDIFVADGHGEKTNARIVKFSKDGKFIKTWGKAGKGQGEFDVPHALAMDSNGRLFVAEPHPDLRPGWKISRRMGAVRPAERPLHRPQRHSLRGGFPVGREIQYVVPAGHPDRQRQRRQCDGLHHGRRAEPPHAGRRRG